MVVHLPNDALPHLPGSVLTVGTFDGVHQGHRKLIEQVVGTAQRHRSPAVLITFHPHPRQVICPELPPLQLLTTLEEKIELLQPLSVDHLVVVPFTEAFSRMTAETFVEDFLVKHFHPTAVVIGYNHQFGHHRDGNIDLLRRMADRLGFEVEEVPAQLVDDMEASSTRIRQALLQGNIDLANRLLTYPYFLSGTVVAGQRLGRRLGFPTANLQPAAPEKLVPADGVYVVRVRINNRRQCQPGLTAIGKRPTFGGTSRTIETYLLDFDEELYGAILRIEFLHFLRPERSYSSAEELIAAMKADERAARLLSGMPAGTG